MKKVVNLSLVVIVILSCNSSQQSTSSMNSLSRDEKNNGWQLLFDGKTTNGWHKYGGTGVGSAWKVGDGTLYLDPSVKDGGDIVSENEFDNFHLSLEWNISKNGNSGVIFYIHEDKPTYEWPWNTGPEMQVLDNNGHPDAKIVKHRAGDLYDLVTSTPETVKPPGEWNLAEIKSLNGHLEFYLNGVKVVSTTLWDDNWKNMVANSKFKSMPAFGTFKKGRIGLQDHGDIVQFRNIKIRQL